MCNSLNFSLIIVLLFSHRVKRYKKIVFEFYFFSTYLSVRWHSIEVQGGIVARFLFNFVWEFVESKKFRVLKKFKYYKKIAVLK